MTSIRPGRAPRRVILSAATASIISLALAPSDAGAQAPGSTGPPSVQVVSDAAGTRLQVDGVDFMVFGMNWGYIPIGENYLYNLWQQPDEVIEEALDREMSLLQSMGVNVIRQYMGIPPRWVQYIYERYGIFTVLNHPCARYGFTIDGLWVPSVDYSDLRLREAVTAEVVAVVEQFQGVPGMLMWLLGNENNYGLSWSSFEIEALPEGERDAARARYLYSLFEDITQAIQQRDPRPVAIANGDLQYIDIIAQECRSLDVLGTNVYRGISARDLFQVVKDKLDIPVMFTEFGADAWNAKEMREDQVTQARYLIGQWQEIYEQSSGKGRVGNAIGGLVFQWADGWWKFGQDSRLDIHDTNASWPNGGYSEDYVEGENNMNEEWWGICAKGHPDGRGLYNLYPRAAYYALKQAFTLPAYAPETNLWAIRSHFATLSAADAALQARGDRAALVGDMLEKVRLRNVRLQFETYSTGGKNISTPPVETPQSSLPAFRGFDHMESFYVDVEVKPRENVTGHVSFNVLGHVPVNRIDEIFYENRGVPREVKASDESDILLEGIERVKVYQAGMSWDDRNFRLDGFYRTGHTHWGYEGDFFSLYRDAYYGENLDIYNGEAPVGFEWRGKKGLLSGLKIAYGPQLWWGANPAILLKYQRRIGPFQATAIYQDDLAPQGTVSSSVAVPIPPTNTATLHLETEYRGLGIEVGGIWSGEEKVGRSFQIVEETEDGYDVLLDEVRDTDTFGAKARLTYSQSNWRWYAQAAYMGLVANGGPTAIITYTDWALKDSGWGNQTNLMTGLFQTVGNLQGGWNLLYQKPIVGPIPSDAPPPAVPRNIFDDPFAVRTNRETLGAEYLLSYEPTPATWMWAWDNDVREDAPLAASLRVTFRHLPTTQDAAIGVFADGSTFAFPGAPPGEDLWDGRIRIVSRLGPSARLVAHLYAGTGQANGSDPRLIKHYGGDARLAVGHMAFAGSVKVDDWGPYDYHRDFNLTFPLQLMGDVSRTLDAPKWFGFTQTRFGVRTTWRSLDQYSPRYCTGLIPGPPGSDPECDTRGPLGREWEIRTYVDVTL